LIQTTKLLEITGHASLYVGFYIQVFWKGEPMRSQRSIIVLISLLVIPMLVFAMATGNAGKGKEVFQRCSVCHGSSGEGNAAIAKAYGVQMPVLGSKEVQSLDDAALRKVITEGKGKMKPVTLSAAEMDDVIAFLRSLKK
jgi:mono/diheme cytochrome c family protein